MTSSSPVRVILADDHAAFRKGLRTFLDSSGEIEVVGEASTANEAIELSRELSPDVVVMDIQMPMDAEMAADLGAGIEATRKIVGEESGMSVLILTGLGLAPQRLQEAMSARARGFATKHADPDVVLSAIKGVARGEVWIVVPREYDMVIDLIAGVNVLPAGLTGRKRDVALLVVQGFNNAEIARRLDIAPRTVANIVTGLLDTFAVSHRGELILRLQEIMGTEPRTSRR